jgi:hypothetical protein
MKYYAKGIDIDGNDVDLHVGHYGGLYCAYRNLVSLETNAKTVSCEDNCLTELNLPNATLVNCQNNCLTELNLSEAKFVYCNNNKSTELNLPNAIEVYCDNNNLKTIFNLILYKSINRTELKMSIRIR